MGNSDIDEIKNRLNIEDVVSEYIKLKKAGSGLTALCPFHSEKSPSFHVSPDRGIYKCFGCGESGDIFSFVSKFENSDFPEVKKKLAQKAGVTLTDFSSKSPADQKKKKEQKQKEEKLLKLLSDATDFFHVNLLKNQEAKKYLKKRGVDEKMAKKFRLGFALNDWNTLENFLLNKGFSKEEILEVGLTKKNDSGKIYDRFRNRIVFPIFDKSDNPVAFSARDLSGSDKVAKYLNSPETPFYDKSSILFGLNFAKVEARKRKYFILVEGQMDLVMSHKVGFENTVASSGTSLTENHLKSMSGFSKNLIFAFDSDKAGIEAAFRGIKKALALDFDVKILDIPEGSDPADMILEDEKKWKDIVKNSKNIVDFYIKKINNSDKNLKEKVFQMEEKILPFVAEIKNPIEKGKYISKISSGFGVDQKFVLDALKIEESKDISDQKSDLKVKSILNKKVDIFGENNIIEKSKKTTLKQMAAIYFWQKSLNKSIPLVDCKEILKDIKKYSTEDVFIKILNLERTNIDYLDSLIFQVESMYSQEDKHKINFDIKSYVDRLEEQNLQQKISEARKKNDLESLIILSRKKDGC